MFVLCLLIVWRVRGKPSRGGCFSVGERLYSTPGSKCLRGYRVPLWHFSLDYIVYVLVGRHESMFIEFFAVIIVSYRIALI